LLDPGDVVVWIVMFASAYAQYAALVHFRHTHSLLSPGGGAPRVVLLFLLVALPCMELASGENSYGMEVAVDFTQLLLCGLEVYSAAYYVLRLHFIPQHAAPSAVTAHVKSLTVLVLTSIILIRTNDPASSPPIIRWCFPCCPSFNAFIVTPSLWACCASLSEWCRIIF
jgi:hypothetical protein